MTVIMVLVVVIHTNYDGAGGSDTNDDGSGSDDDGNNGFGGSNTY